MLGDSRIQAVVPTHDLSKSRAFYEDTLGLKVKQAMTEGAVLFEAGNTELLLYRTQVAIPAEHTVCAFEVDDVERVVADLESRGVTFEEYDLSEYGFEGAGDKGKIVELPDGEKSAWFTDPEGNILAVGSR